MQLQPISSIAPSVAAVTGPATHAPGMATAGALARALGLSWLSMHRLGQGSARRWRGISSPCRLKTGDSASAAG
jgi:hypothetical protein